MTGRKKGGISNSDSNWLPDFRLPGSMIALNGPRCRSRPATRGTLAKRVGVRHLLLLIFPPPMSVRRQANLTTQMVSAHPPWRRDAPGFQFPGFQSVPVKTNALPINDTTTSPTSLTSSPAKEEMPTTTPIP